MLPKFIVVIVLHVFITFFFILGLTLIITGVCMWFLKFNEMYDGLAVNKSTALTILILMGIIFCVINLVGCFGAYTGSKLILIIFTIIVGTIGLAIVIFGYWILNYEIKDLAEQLKEYMIIYPTDETAQVIIDGIQFEYKCCGIHGPEDWKKIAATEVPQSCCKVFNITKDATPPKKLALCTETYNVHHDGCLDIVKDRIDFAQQIVGYCVITIGLLQKVEAAISGILTLLLVFD